GPQISQPSAVTWAVQFIGSIVAWARNCDSYSARKISAPGRVIGEWALLKSPSARTVSQGPSSSAARYWAITLSLESDAFGPSSKLTRSARRARAASQYVLPTTAMPLGMGTTSTTPGRPRTDSLSNVFTWPPKTGLCFTAAYSIPGTRKSRPKTAVPFSLDGSSTRGRDRPRSFQSFGALRGGFSGDVCVAAASTSSPKLSARPV